MNERVIKYFNAIAEKLHTEHLITATGINPVDIGFNRELLVKRFLENHLPKRLSVHLGGYVFGYDSSDSKQIDVIVKNDIGLNFHEQEKTFTPVENIASAFSVKSMLDSKNLIDALDNLGSIPQIEPNVLQLKTLHPTAKEMFILQHPTFYIFAYEGMTKDSTIETINKYYSTHAPNINRYPAGIIVNKKYFIRFSHIASKNFNGEIIPAHTFYGYELSPDIQGIPFLHILSTINDYSEWLSFMSIDYSIYIHTAVENIGKYE